MLDLLLNTPWPPSAQMTSNPVRPRLVLAVLVKEGQQFPVNFFLPISCGAMEFLKSIFRNIPSVTERGHRKAACEACEG